MRRSVTLVLLTLVLLTSSVAEAQTPPTKQGVGSVTNDCAIVEQVGASWFYNWWWNPAQCRNVTPYLMIWNDQTQPENWRWLTDGAVVMGYNEPDLVSQANLTPDQAARHWHDFVEPTFPDKPLIAPAPAFGTTWLTQMYAAYVTRYGQPPRFDGGLTLHCYGNSATECVNKTNSFIAQAQAWGVPGVWVTEWSICDLSEAQAFRQWMEDNQAVIGYAWFSDAASYSVGGCDTRLVIDGKLTAFGEWYRGLPLGLPTETPQPTATYLPTVTASPTVGPTKTPRVRPTKRPHPTRKPKGSVWNG